MSVPFTFIEVSRKTSYCFLAFLSFLKHFSILGRPADFYAVNHPDWAPTKNMGHQSASVSKASKSTALERHDRVLQRSAKRRCLEEQLQRSVEISDNNEDEGRFNSSLSDDEGSHRDLEEGQRSHRATQTNKGESKDMGCQTFLKNDDIETLLKNKNEGRKSFWLRCGAVAMATGLVKNKA